MHHENALWAMVRNKTDAVRRWNVKKARGNVLFRCTVGYLYCWLFADVHIHGAEYIVLLRCVMCGSEVVFRKHVIEAAADIQLG